MKFSKIALAGLLAASSSFAQDCRTKEGQQHFVNGLMDQWKLYKQQVRMNEGIDDDIAAVEADRQARLAEQLAQFTEKKANQSILQAAYLAAIELRKNETIQELADERDRMSDQIRGTFDAKRARELNTFNTKTAKASTIKDAALADIARVNGKKVAKLATVESEKDDKIQAAQADRDAKLAKIASQALQMTQSADSTKNTRLARYAQQKLDAEAEALAEFNAKKAAIEANLQDADATLASLDNAGTTGLEYPGDCILGVDDVVEKVKEGLTANEIWKSLL